MSMFVPGTYRHLIEEKDLSGDADVEFSSIPSTYNDLLIAAQVRSSSGAVAIDMLVNNLTGFAYYSQGIDASNTTLVGFQNIGGTSVRVGATGAYSTWYTPLYIWFPNYADSGLVMSWTSLCGRIDGGSSGETHWECSSGQYISNAAISTIDLLANGAALFEAGSVFRLYGIR